MTLDNLVTQGWTQVEALNCWNSFHTKYLDKYKGALHHAICYGTSDLYINRECRVFARYARMWKYQRDKVSFHAPEQYATPNVNVIATDWHHLAQENKLKRYKQGGCQC